MKFRSVVVVAACCLGLQLFAEIGGRAETDPAPLEFFKNYFVTGDYAVAGVGLQGQGGKSGVATGTIDLAGRVPDGAEVLAAFLYYQVVSADGPDGGVINATFNGHTLWAPYFSEDEPGGPLAAVANPDGASPCWSSGGGTGKGGSKRTFTYRTDVMRFLRIDEDSGRYSFDQPYEVQLPDLGNSNKTPIALGATLLVVYRDPDPEAALRSIVIYDGSHTMNNEIQSMSLRMAGFYDPADAPGRLTHIVGSGQANKTETLYFPGMPTGYVDPFTGADGPSWDTRTFETTGVDASGDSLTTVVDNGGSSTFDCVTWGAVVYSTPVNDRDGDGLLDRWETDSGLTDPNGDVLPDLAAMGADPDTPDVFVEIDYMEALDALSYGGEVKPAHTHRPTDEALAMVVDAFAAQGIAAHVDVSDAIDETITQCERAAGDPPWVCQFSAYPGTVGWKSGLRFLRDAGGLDGAPLFDHARKDMFRYAFFAHALGVPKDDCLGEDGFPDPECQDAAEPNPYHIPATYTGVGDYPGGDLLVTLGGFDDADGLPVGSDYIQASTLMHELGHTFQLRHGGGPLEPNCKPNYLSVMNYLFQLRGLRREISPGDVQTVIDFSGDSLAVLQEWFLSDGMLGYPTGWYAPQGSGTIGSPASRHCDGSPLLTDENGNPTEPPMVRVDGMSGAIDWDVDPATLVSVNQDINFDGLDDQAHSGYDDWANLRLNQVGSRRNVGGWYWVLDAAGNPVAFMGPMSLDVGRGDLGRGDLGRGDLGRGDLGRGDLGRGDLGRGDLGRGDLGAGSDEAAELDLGLAAASGYAPPNALTATLNTGPCGTTPFYCVDLRWAAPHVGTVSYYQVYRGTDTEAPQPVFTSTTTSVTDDLGFLFGTFTYVVTATFTDGTESGPSNAVTIDVPPPQLGFVGVKNLPPPEGREFNAGSVIPLEWQFTVGGTVVDSSFAAPTVTITGPSGSIMFTPEDPGSSSFQPPTEANGWSWQFNFQTNDPITGTPLPVGSYTVTIGSPLTGQVFPEVGVITITLR